MAAVAMETAKILKKKNEKHKNDHSSLLAKQKFMKFDRNNILSQNISESENTNWELYLTS
jgi:hypothetical protein